MVGRAFGRLLEEKVGQPVVIEDRPGASGILGTQAAKNAAPDGYTFLISTNSTHSANEFLFKSIPYDPKKDFDMVGLFGVNGSVAVVPANSPYKTLPELEAYARKNPGKVFFGHASSASQVPSELLKARGNLPINGAPYKNITQIVTDLLGGQIGFAFLDYLTPKAQIEAKGLIPLAVTANERYDAWPDVPTMNSFYPGFEVMGWFGLSAPKGTPKDVIQRVNTVINEGLKRPEVVEQFRKLGLTVRPMSVADVETFVSQDRTRWQEWIKLAKIEPL